MQLNPFSAIQSAFQERGAQLVCKAVNHLLELEPTVKAHLSNHSGRTVLLKWEQIGMFPSGQQCLTMTEGSTLFPHQLTNDAVADVTVSLQAGLLQAANEERLRFIRIEGDALLAQDLSLVAKQLRWDAEHDLSRVIGGTAAHWVTHHGKKAATLFQQAVEQFKSTTADAVIHYPGWVVAQSDFAMHRAELLALKARIDALATRMTGLKR